MRVLPLAVLASLAAVEGGASWSRFEDRKRLYALAKERAEKTGRTLVVVGDPDGGTHTRFARAYGCGDVCLDLHGCAACPVQYEADITKPVTEVPDDSAIVFVSCVLEYVEDIGAASQEILRMAGSTENVFVATVQPWTMTSILYPGARWKLHAAPTVPGVAPAFRPEVVSTGQKVASLAVVFGLLAWALLPASSSPPR